MASFRKREGKNGTVWQARIYVSGKAAVKSFPTKTAAVKWAATEESAMLDRSVNPDGRLDATGITVSQALAEWAERRPADKRNYRFNWLLGRFDSDFGAYQLTKLNSLTLEKHFRERAKTVTPQTITIELSYLRGFWESAALRYDIRADMVQTTRKLLKESALVAASVERSRRPSKAELIALRVYFNEEYNGKMPMADMMDFSIATCVRRGELLRITRADWTDSNRAAIVIRDRKDPRNKQGNDMSIPLLGNSNAILRRQPDRGPLFFPYDGKTVTTCFRLACRELGIEDLVWHDLRHEGISRLAESGWTIPQMCKVSGHKKWEHLKRYDQSSNDNLYDLPYRG